MKTKVLVFGLPGSGKTTFAKKLVTTVLDSKHINADEVRKTFNDWDFSRQGRIQQAHRMHMLCETNKAALIVCDFVCPFQNIRDELFGSYIRVYMNTIRSSRFADTNSIFEQPTSFDFEITDYNEIDLYVKKIIELIGKEI